jgi:hypothetical protein
MANFNPVGTNIDSGYNTRTTIRDSLVDSAGGTIPGGLVGNTGISGSTGVGGITGIIGATGASVFGATGIQGETGVFSTVGETGIQGIVGVIGNTGLNFPGVTGLVGLTGSGSTGLAGDFGIDGFPGTTGITNTATGLQGLTGTRGITGLVTDPGRTGIFGRTGITITGLRGITGAVLGGATGIIGNTGVFGITGLDNLDILNIQRQLVGVGSTLIYMVPANLLENNNQQLDFLATIQTPIDATPGTINMSFGGVAIFSDRLAGITGGAMASLEGTIIRTGTSAQLCVVAATYTNNDSHTQRTSTSLDTGVTQILGVDINTSGDNGTVFNMITKMIRS